VKKIMIGFAALLIIAGGAVAAMKWLGIGPFEAVDVAAVEKEPEEPKEETIFIDMDPLMLPVIKGSQIAGTIQIQIKLETQGTDNAIFLKRRLTKVSDAFVKDLHGFVPRLLKKKERLDVIILKDRLKLIGQRLLGKGYIDDVLVQSVIETPAR